MYPTISSWCGRFGNNVQQISNAIYFCRKNNLHFYSPDNQYIRPFSIRFGDTLAPSDIYFFYSESETGQGGPNFPCDEEELNSQRKEICETYILPNLKINLENMLTLKEDICVLHIRSGDIFSRENFYHPVISRYLQNPLSYYKYVIKQYNKCVCVFEDANNPIIGELKKIDNVVLCRSTFEADLSLMLSCQNMITSGVSTFSSAAALLSKNLKTLHATDIILKECLNPVMLSDKINLKITKIDQEKYIKINEWLNTEEQRQKMISYEQNYE